MGDSFSITADRLRESGGQITGLSACAGGLGTRVLGDASIWGSDEAGAAFGDAYTELVSAATDAFTALAEGLDTVGHNLRAMADTVETADQMSSDRFHQITGQV